MKSEKNYPFTLFEKWKVKWFFLSLFSRSESEIEIPRDRDREVKFQNNSREFSRNETLAGYCFEAFPHISTDIRNVLDNIQLSYIWCLNQETFVTILNLFCRWQAAASAVVMLWPAEKQDLLFKVALPACVIVDCRQK